MALTIGRGHHSPREVVDIPLRGAVRLRHAGDVALGVVLQLLAGSAHAVSIGGPWLGLRWKAYHYMIQF